MNPEILKLIPPFLGLIALAWIIRRRLLLRARGVEVAAHCYDREWRGKGGPTFLLSYRAPDGRKMSCTASESDVPSGTRVGTSVTVCYDPREPGRVETALTARKPLWKQGDVITLVVVEAVLLLMVAFS
ncbi:DUF3592 domain-containing protein [Streptomyces enissocaesilis]|uniref:DUF3592 domain-containing protein n=1 Tax=Streptomyces enissocaesilis TaxID=332589 RepID=A0ABP6K7W3_9ACTN